LAQHHPERLRYICLVVRLGLVALPLVAACTGEIESANFVGLDPTEAAAQATWINKALPVFNSICITCHGGSMPDIAYIAGTDDLARRETLVNYVPRIVNLDAPASSRVVTKGDHTDSVPVPGGPAMTTDQVTDVLVWINAEAKARPNTAPPIRTDKYTPMLCTAGNPGDATCPINSIDLTPLGTAGSLEFTVKEITGGAYFQALKFKAGASGLYLEHPLFESYAGGADPGIPDPTDRFFATTLNLMPDTEATFGLAGGETIAGFAPTDPITIRFDALEAFRPGT
jgi:hypothetical protein